MTHTSSKSEETMTMEHKHTKDMETNPGHSVHHSNHAIMFRNKFFVALFLSIPILILSPMDSNMLDMGLFGISFVGQRWLIFGLSTILFLYGGKPFLDGMISEIRKKQIGMMTLITIAISTAYFYSSGILFGLKGMPFFWELATLIDVMLLGHWIEMRATMGASKSLEELVKLLPTTAHKLDQNNQLIDVELNSLVIGDKILVKPGEKIPADGVVIDGHSYVNESALTGESKPVQKNIGQSVIGVALNGSGSLTIQVTKIGEDSFLNQIIKLVKEAQDSKSKLQNLANKAAFWLTVVALTVGFGSFVFWMIIDPSNPNFALERLVTVLVIACPHALGIAIPLVVARSTTLASMNGFLIRNRIAFEQARNIQAVVMDKTGTLTFGNFGVTDKLIFGQEFDEKTVIQYAAALETKSEHPIAKGITALNTPTIPVENFEAITGQGVQGKVEGNLVQVVSPGYLISKNILIPEAAKNFMEQGKTTVFVVINGSLAGAIALADTVRPESKPAILELQKMGIRTIMLTGDSLKVAQSVALELGIDEVLAEVLPNQKSQKIKDIQAKGFVTAMIGDGINDAPALATADIGIAIGAGTDVAIETADLILVKSNPGDIAKIIKLAKSTYSKTIQNLWWASGYNIVAIPLAAGLLHYQGLDLSPAVGGIFMAISTVIVSFNANKLQM